MNNQRIQSDGNQNRVERGAIRPRSIIRVIVLFALMILITLGATRLRADTGNCSGAVVNVPFTDVAGSPFFCQIATAYFSGLTYGTSVTTYSPGDFVTREQMAAFITRTLDQSLERGNRRAALKRFSTPKANSDLDFVIVGSGVEPVPIFGVESDGEDLWSSDLMTNTVKRVQASDGKLLGTWTGIPTPWGLCVAKGRIYTASATTPGQLSVINPKLAPGAVTTGATNLGGKSHYLAYDGEFIWSADYSGSVSQVNINALACFDKERRVLAPERYPL